MMNNEDFDRKMVFIADQQARFAVGMQQLRDQQAQFAVGMQELRGLHAETEKAIANAENVVARLAHATLVGFKNVNAKIDALVDSHIRMENSHRGIEEALRDLIRYLSGRRNSV